MLWECDSIVYVLQVKVRGIAGYLGPVCPFEGKNSYPLFLINEQF